MLAFNQIFGGSHGNDAKRYILLLGNAGMGKSTLIKKLCLNWSKDHFPQFDFVFLLDGRMLTLTKPNFSLQTLLLHLSSCTTACLAPDAVYAQVRAAPKRVLVIFDGFGDIRDFEALMQPQEKDLTVSLQKDSKTHTYTIKQLYAGILQKALLPGCTLLLAARPRGAASQVLRRTDCCLDMCGFSPSDVTTYLSRYFDEPSLRESALDCLRSCSYLQLLCWNPGLCRLVCSVLSKNLGELPRTLTELCRQVLDLRVGGGVRSLTATCSSDKHADVQPKRSRRAKIEEKEDEKEKAEEATDVGKEPEELLSQLSSLAWDGVKSQSSVVPGGWTLSSELKAFGHRTGLLVSHDLRTRHLISSGETKGGGGEAKGPSKRRKKVCEDRGTARDQPEDHILQWASPYLQSYLAALHLCLSRWVLPSMPFLTLCVRRHISSQTPSLSLCFCRIVVPRTFVQSLPLLSGQKSRRRSHRVELELTQRFAFGILTAKVETLHVGAQASLKDILVSKQTCVTKHLEGLSHADLNPAQLLEACHYVYEVSVIRDEAGRKRSGAAVAKLPEVLALRGVPLSPLDAYVVRHVLERAGREGPSFCLDVEDSGIQISGLKSLVGLSNVNTYRYR